MPSVDCPPPASLPTPGVESPTLTRHLHTYLTRTVASHSHLEAGALLASSLGMVPLQGGWWQPSGAGSLPVAPHPPFLVSNSQRKSRGRGGTTLPKVPHRLHYRAWVAKRCPDLNGLSLLQVGMDG